VDWINYYIVSFIVANFSDAPVQLEDGSKATIKQLGQILTPQPDKILINLTNQPEVYLANESFGDKSFTSILYITFMLFITCLSYR